MLLQDINPFVRQALVSKLTSSNKGDVFNRIQTVDCRFFYIASGSGSMRFDHRIYSLSAGTVIIFNAGTPYVWETESIDYYAFNFDYTQNHAYVKKSFHPISSHLFSVDDIIEKTFFEDEPLLNTPLVINFVPELEKDVKKILTEYLMGGEYSNVLTSTMLKHLIVESVKRKKALCGTQKEKANMNVCKIIEYVSKNYAKEITYQTLEQEFHFNPLYLNRIFKKYTGSSVYSFILQYRMNVAMEILRTQKLSVKQTAELCGFDNPYHFTKAFTKLVGVPPTAYKNNQFRKTL